MLTWGCIWIDLDYRKVWIGTEEIRLAHQDYMLFCLLVSSPKRILAYEQLSQHMWGVGPVLAANSLHSCIRRIRNKLGQGD